MRPSPESKGAAQAIYIERVSSPLLLFKVEISACKTLKSVFALRVVITTSSLLSVGVCSTM